MSDRQFIGFFLLLGGLVVLLSPLWNSNLGKDITRFVDEVTGFGQLVSAIGVVVIAVAFIFVGIRTMFTVK